MIQKNKKEEIEEGIFYGEMKEKAIDQSLDNSIKDGATASVALGAGENFISAYAIAMSASNFQLGILSALPSLMPGEIISTKLMNHFSRKNIIIKAKLVQAALWLPILLISLLFLKDIKFAPWLLIVFYSTYTLVGFMINPAWGSWMKDLTAGREIGKYFGLRNKIVGFVSLLATLAAGFILDFFKNRKMVFIGFGLLFIASALGKFISTRFVRKKYEPKFKIEKEAYFSFWQFLKKAPSNNYGRFAIFFAAMNMATYISAPFFAPYMLKDLQFSYITFTMINLVISAVATLLFMPLWGEFIDRHGCVKTLQITSYLVPIIPLLWLLSPSLWWLVFIQVLTGIVWAGFNLAAGNFTYDAVTRPRMALCIAYTATLTSIGIFLGAIAGGLLASFTTISMNIYFFVFVVSGLARLAVTVLFLPRIKEIRPNISQMKLYLKMWRPFNTGNSAMSRVGEIVELPFHLLKTRKR